MKLIDMEVKEYLDVLKSDAPAPGGGSVSALAGAQGVALFTMVADLTLGKEKYAEYQEVCREAKEKGCGALCGADSWSGQRYRSIQSGFCGFQNAEGN